jgi:putative addiction module component (TIGR02574 family)
VAAGGPLDYISRMRVPIDLTGLSTFEKLDLLHEVWKSLPKKVATPTLSRSVKRMLDTRLEDLARNPGASSPWPAVRERLFPRRRKR